MALCPNKNTRFYKSLEETYGSRDGWRIAHRTMKPAFEKWYGKGKKDKYGNPVIVNDGFINEQGERADIYEALYPTEEERQLWKEGEARNWESPLTGVPSKLSKSQWVHTRTEGFLTWFGDWTNKAALISKDVLDPQTREPKIFERENKKVFLRTSTVETYGDIAAAESNNGEFPVGRGALHDTRLDLKKAEHADHIKAQATRLKNIFYTHGVDVEVMYDTTLPKNSDVTYHGNGKATIVVNPNRLFNENIPHEFSHLYIDMLGYDNKTVQKAISQAKKAMPEDWEKVQAVYSDQTLEEQEKELLVVAMASNAAEIGESDRAKSAWQYTLNSLWRAIAGLFGKERDFAKELYLDMIYDKFAGAKVTNLQTGTKDSRLLKIFDDNDNIYLDSTLEEPAYKNSENLSASYYRGTEFTNGRNEEDKESIPGLSPKILSGNKGWEKWKADTYFENAELNKETDKLKITTKDEAGEEFDEEITYDELVDRLTIRSNTHREYGNIIHLIMQRETMKMNGENVDAINKDIDERAAEKPGKQEEIVISKLGWLVSSIEAIFQSVGLNIYDVIDPADKDRLEAEVVLHSDSLGVATTADTIIEHSDGRISMLDWKGGTHFLDDAYETSKLLKYSDPGKGDMYDTKVGRAKMEMTLRTLILKEQQPDVKFKDIKVVHLNRLEGTKEFHINLDQTLPILERFLMTERPKEYGALIAKNPKIFDATEYREERLENKEMYDKSGYSREQIIQEMTNDLFTLSTKKNKTLQDRDTIAELTKEIMAMEGPAGLDLNPAHSEDLSAFGRWLGNKYSKNNPLIRKYFANHFNPAKEAIKKERAEIQQKHNKVLLPLLKEYLDKKNIKYDVSKIGTDYAKGVSYLLGLIGYTVSGSFGAFAMMQVGAKAGQMYKRKISTQELYGFMYDIKEGVEERGRFLKKNTSDMTPAQQAYHKFFRDTIQEQYQMTMNRKVYVPNLGTVKPLWEVAGVDQVLADDFIPRIPMETEEIYERKNSYGEKARQMWKDIEFSWKKHITSTHQEGKYDDIMMGMNLRYMGSRDQIASEYHSINGELMFNTFIDHLITKRHMDQAYAVGQGVITVMEGHPHGDEHFKNAIEFMKDQLEQNVLGKTQKELEDKWKFKVPKFTLRHGEGLKVVPDQYMYVDISKFMNSLKGFTSMITMWLKFWAGTANAALILTLSVKDAMKGSWAKAKGEDISNIDFTLSDLIFAEKQILKYWLDLARGKADQNKLHLFQKKYDWLPKNYDYKIEDNDTYTGRLKLFNQGSLYNFHTIPEEWGTQILMVAQLNKMKAVPGDPNSKSMWDSYDIKDGELVWKGGERFKVKMGDGYIKTITELTPEEITKLKRITQRIHGGYRREERTSLELYGIGKWLLQFKKYLPAIMENALNDRYEDESLGKFEKIEGSEEDLYKWVPRMHEGRINTFAKVMASWATKGSYAPLYHPKTGKLSAEDKQNVKSVWLSLSMWTAITIMAAMAFDDDDDKDPFQIKLKHLAQNTTQDINPFDWINAIKSPTVVISKLYDLWEAIFDFWLEGVVQGRRVKSGPNKGRIYGAYQTEKTLPILSSTSERNRYWDAMISEAQ